MITISLSVEYARKWVRGDADSDLLQEVIEMELETSEVVRDLEEKVGAKETSRE